MGLDLPLAQFGICKPSQGRIIRTVLVNSDVGITGTTKPYEAEGTPIIDLSTVGQNGRPMAIGAYDNTKAGRFLSLHFRQRA
jgi:hypothetical protein